MPCNPQRVPFPNSTFLLITLTAALCTPASARQARPAEGVPGVVTSALAKPRVTLISASHLTLPGSADSNSPAVWSLVEGRATLQILTSFAGWPSRAQGAQLSRMGTPLPVSIEGTTGGVWMESVITSEDGTWYGYYHNELVSERCGASQKMFPRLGAARSSDRGLTWESLGTVLESPGYTTDCDTNNAYFVGGVGDFSVLLDHDSKYLYFFFSQYAANPQSQGIGVARLPWSSRDEPAGWMAVWAHGVWLPSRAMRVRTADGSWRRQWSYPVGYPIYAAAESWHDDDLLVDAFWGPSVHWNTHLRKYVMLLNRARDAAWRQEGIYVAFADTLDEPTSWSPPEKILSGGRWYPQVIGLEAGTGSDKIAGGTARLFINGESRHLVTFEK